MNRNRIFLVFSTAAMLGSAVVGTTFAQTDHSGHGATQAQAGSGSNSVLAYKAAAGTMHEAMSAVEYTGDADIDFARGMIPHHRAAIEMARIVLQYGKDPEIRKLAEAVIEAQEGEIRQLETWLAAHVVK